MTVQCYNLKSLVFYSSFRWLPNPVLQLSNRKAKQRKTSHQRGPISKPHFSFLGFQVLSIYSMEKTNGWKPEKPLVEECHLFCLKFSTFFGVRKSWVIPGVKSTESHSCSLILKSLRSQLVKKNIFEDTEVVLLSETYAPQTLPSHWPALFFWMSPQVQWIQRWNIKFFWSNHLNIVWIWISSYPTFLCTSNQPSIFELDHADLLPRCHQEHLHLWSWLVHGSLPWVLNGRLEFQPHSMAYHPMRPAVFQTEVLQLYLPKSIGCYVLKKENMTPQRKSSSNQKNSTQLNLNLWIRPWLSSPQLHLQNMQMLDP